MPYKIPMQNGIAVPKFEIFIDGKEIPESYYKLVEEVTYESHASGSDIATIIIKDPFMQIIDDSRIIRGMRITLKGGWVMDVANWLDGYIAMVDVEFPESGDPTITLNCMDESFLMDRADVKDNYANMTFAQLSQLIGHKYGLRANGTPTDKTHEELSQNNESDMKFLLRVADDEDLVIKVVKGTITWKPKEEIGKSQDTLTWRDYPFNLKSFSPRVVLADMKKEIEKAEINSDNLEIEEGKADAGTPRDVAGETPIVWERGDDKYTKTTGGG